LATLADTLPINLLPAEEQDRRQRRSASACPQLWTLLDQVMDPEIPVISIWELGVLQNVTRQGNTVEVTITPTYSGCPAMDVIEQDISRALAQAGFADHRIIRRLSPAWTTDWMSADAKEKLRAYGIAPPCRAGAGAPDLHCPHCGSEDVRQVSEYGSTACKALFQCRDCAEPFDYFKGH
jgi:ring-1,2-phenylacetyl-CoA epoxidase subunit PaaD